MANQQVERENLLAVAAVLAERKRLKNTVEGSMTVPQLKMALRNKVLSLSGSKEELLNCLILSKTGEDNVEDMTGVHPVHVI